VSVSVSLQKALLLSSGEITVQAATARALPCYPALGSTDT